MKGFSNGNIHAVARCFTIILIVTAISIEETTAKPLKLASVQIKFKDSISETLAYLCDDDCKRSKLLLKKIKERTLGESFNLNLYPNLRARNRRRNIFKTQNYFKGIWNYGRIIKWWCDAIFICKFVLI